MQKIDFALWLPVFSALLGAILQSLTADGGASVLDHFGITWRAPKPALAVLVLACTVGSGAVDALVAGDDLQRALATGAAAGVMSVFGAVGHHAVTTGRAGAAVLLLLVASATGACGAFLHEARAVTIDMALCLQANADMPDDKAFEMCGVEEALREAGRQILGSEREKRDRIARAAAERAEHDVREKMTAAGCDGGMR